MTELLYFFQAPLRVLSDLVKHSTPDRQDTKVAARKFSAGSKKIMTAAERQDFLRNSYYGRVLGVSSKLENQEVKSNKVESHSSCHSGASRV